MTHYSRILTLATVCLALGCGAGGDSDSADRIDWSGKNCLVVVLDALTVNHLALWGYHRETTPNIDRLASKGVVFKFARSQGSSTPPSTYSYFVGQYPNLLVRGTSGHMVQMPPEQTTFAETFDEAGYDTAAFSGNLFVAQKTGFDQGFDEFELILRHLPVNTTDIKLDQESTEKLLASAKNWIQAREENPWLCYLHILRPHNPYNAPEPQGTAFTGDYDGPINGSDAYWKAENWRPPKSHMPRLKDYYDGNLLYTDALLGEFLDELSESGDMDDTVVIVTSDHGEAFMEHGFVLHGETVHEEMIRVPLIVIPPPGSDLQPRTVDDPVQLIDLLPTMTSLFGLATPEDVDGLSLEPLMRGKSIASRPTFAQDSNGDIICIVEDGYKLHMWYDTTDSSFKPYSYFHVDEDPGEQDNLWRNDPPRRATKLFERTQAYIEAHKETTPGTVDTVFEYEEEILETLGYL